MALIEEIQKRNIRADYLKVFRVSDSEFYVESSEGKVAYKVTFNGTESCSCADYMNNSRREAGFRCKHILAVVNSEGIEDVEYLDKKKPKLDKSFISVIQGKEFVQYAGLLDLGHQKGIIKLESKPIQLPCKENNFECICIATLESKKGDVFIDIGDANPKNCNSMIASHLIRMASTRAKARVLRDFTNIGITSFEELGDIEEVISNKSNVEYKSHEKYPHRNTLDRAKQNKHIEKKVYIKPSDNNSVEIPNNDEIKKTETANSNDEPLNNNSDITQSKPDIAKDTVSETKPNSKQKLSNDTPEKNNKPKISEAQMKALINLANRRGISTNELITLSIEKFGVPFEELSSGNAGVLIRYLQSAA